MFIVLIRLHPFEDIEVKQNASELLEKDEMKNLEWCRYTYLHRRAFAYCVRKLVNEPALRREMLARARVHDMDKMIMYLFMDQQEAQALHMQTKTHHLENNLPKTYEDLVETVIDYECAPYTKPDKPLNAFDFTKQLMEYKVLDAETGAELMGIMEMLGIAYSSSVAEDREGISYISGIGDVTEEMILEEILRYVNDKPDNELEWILKQERII